MDETKKRIFQRIFLDAFVLSIVGLPLLYFIFWGDANKRGFYCDDKSIQNPYMNSTVRSWMLYVIGLVIPVAVIFLIEFLISRKNNVETSQCRFYNLLGIIELPSWLFDCYEKLGVFAFGAAICQLTVDIAKYSIGRLRPHFLEVCQPVLADGTTCDDPRNFGKYIEEFSCRGENFSQRLLKETRLSFPSGHSSFTFFVMIYMTLYLEKRFKLCCGSRFLCLALQACFVIMAWLTAMSRVYDFKHHWSDVAVGGSIGTAFALIVSYKIPSNLFNWHTVWKQDQSKTN